MAFRFQQRPSSDIGAVKMINFSVWILLFAFSLQQTDSAILIHPGLDNQDNPSVAKFHLVANNDVTIRVSSKGLVWDPSSLEFLVLWHSHHSACHTPIFCQL